MSRGYILVSMELLGHLLSLPESVHVVGVMSVEDTRGVVGIVIEGSGLPVGGEIMRECRPVYERDQEFGQVWFKYWMGEGKE